MADTTERVPAGGPRPAGMRWRWPALAAGAGLVVLVAGVVMVLVWRRSCSLFNVNSTTVRVSCPSTPAQVTAGGILFYAGLALCFAALVLAVPALVSSAARRRARRTGWGAPAPKS